MSELGTYRVPLGKAGTDDALCRGKGTNGLDKDFDSALSYVVDKINETGYKLQVGNYGYISLENAEYKAKEGNSLYLEQIKKFGWGLAMEIWYFRNPDGDDVDAYEYCKRGDAAKYLSDAGIGCYRLKKNGVVAMVYFAARSVSESSDVSVLEHDGEGDSARRTGESRSPSSSSSSGVSLASASYFFANQFNAVNTGAESVLYTGERALANDTKLWDDVKKAVNASLRACSSDPDGNFIAWYPDYYGKYGKTPHVIIKDVELQNLTITQSDKEFYSHVFCPGVYAGGGKIPFQMTQGVVSIEGAMAASVSSAAALAGDDLVSDSVSPLLEKMLNIPEGDEWKYTPKELYRRYGARPAKTQSLPNFTSGALIEDVGENAEAQKTHTSPAHILPYLYALYEFMYHWANQYKADIEITFMPELFPGMRIKVESLDIEFYVQSVTHSMDYSSGFTTKVGAICPVGSLVSGMVASSGGE